MNLGEQFCRWLVTKAMRNDNVGAVVVVKGRKVAGIVTDRDLALSLGEGRVTPDSPVDEIMTRKVHTVWDDAGIFNATQAMLGYKVRRLPIVNRDGELVGIVTFDDLLSLFTHELHNIGKALSPALEGEQMDRVIVVS